MQFFENIAIRPDGSSDRTLHDLFSTLKRAELRSNIGIQNHRFKKDLRYVPITDFFGSTIDVHVTNVGYWDDIWWLCLVTSKHKKNEEEGGREMCAVNKYV